MGDTNPPQHATAEERAHRDATTSPAREGMVSDPPPGAPETEDILASIFDETAPTAGQGPPTDRHLHDNESFNAFMASCRDGTPPPDRQPHPRPGNGATRGAHCPYAGRCLHIPPCASSPQLCRLWADGRHPHNHHLGQSCREAAHGGG